MSISHFKDYLAKEVILVQLLPTHVHLDITSKLVVDRTEVLEEKALKTISN